MFSLSLNEGLGTASVEELVAKLKYQIAAKRRWFETEILVIDEISMVSADFFDKLSVIGKRMRNDRRPFGGLQLVVMGDFFQLPPIGVGGNNAAVQFAFQSPVWREIFGGHLGVVRLQKVYRQLDDSLLLQILQEVRFGNISPNMEEILRGKVSQYENSKIRGDSSVASSTLLCPTNREVEALNSASLDRLASVSGCADLVTFDALDVGEEPFLSVLRQGLKAPEVLSVRVGAQVVVRYYDISYCSTSGAAVVRYYGISFCLSSVLAETRKANI